MKKCIRNHSHLFKWCVMCFLTVSLIFLILFMIKKYAPFGNNSLAAMDADIQYLDFHLYYKDVLKGTNSIFYTFGQSLGGSGLALFSYYLASPVSLLVHFFPRTEMHTFFDLMVCIKTGLAAAAMFIFLYKRFRKNNIHSTRCVYLYLLSVCYALCQYNIAQASNIMWLDGVYLLPLMLLGVYNTVHQKNFTVLTVFTAASVVFNWYTGGINCLFSAFWFIFEILFSFSSEDKEKINLKQSIVIYIFSMLLGLGISAFLFLPTIAVIQKSSRGSLDLSSLLDLSLTGKLISVIGNYALGTNSDKGLPSFYCGSLPVIACISLFLSKKTTQKTKVIFYIFTTANIMMYFWNPLMVLFSLLTGVYSYWYRYSYLFIFSLIFMAGYFFTSPAEEEHFLPVKASVLFSLLLLLANNTGGDQNIDNVQKTVIFAGTAGLLLYLAFSIQSGSAKKNLPHIIPVILIVLSECYYGTHLLTDYYHTDNVSDFQDYLTGTSGQIKDIKKNDDSFYRISQTSTRKIDKANLTANYNEALAFNYMSLSTYTSTPDEVQYRFLDHGGYRMEYPIISVVNTSIIGTDSLLGVKYILSGYPINGYRKADNLRSYAGKDVYINPFALPAAFV